MRTHGELPRTLVSSAALETADLNFRRRRSRHRQLHLLHSVPNGRKEHSNTRVFLNTLASTLV